jgi:hypothetical protein
MKFQRAAEFMRVPPDLYKYMVLRLLFPLHLWHCYVQTESNTLCAWGIGGKRLFEGNGRDTRWIVSDFFRALNEATEVSGCWMGDWRMQCTGSTTVGHIIFVSFSNLV